MQNRMQPGKKTSNSGQPAGRQGPAGSKKSNKLLCINNLRKSRGKTNPRRAAVSPQSEAGTRRFSVAPIAAELNPDDILLSARLRGALSQLGVRKLGDLNGVKVSDFLKCRNCGKRSLRELETVLRRAAAGEYSLPQDPSALEPSGTIRALDASLSSLAPRDRDCLIKRFGGLSEETFTLDRIGRRYRLTRERVRQIINGSLRQVRLLLGPAGRLRVQRLLELCRTQVLPLTPELVARWLPRPWPLSLRPAFYARLLAAIWPELPVWTGGELSAPWMDPRKEALVQEVRAAVEAAGGRLACKDAYSRVTTHPKFMGLAPEEFLAGLKDASYAGLKLNLENPERPHLVLA